MTEKTYKHAASVTSQLFFCSAPIRLDAYDGCQFGCVYCFSRRRSRLWASSGVHEASVRAFSDRMKRVQTGRISSALDEFLSARIPIQLGGLHDPFTPREADRRVTLQLLKVLSEHQYPTVISTKGSLPAREEYLACLQNMNVFVRFSAAGISESLRPQVDRRCDNFLQTLDKISKLSSRGIAIGLRLQPVIPGYEEVALEMTRAAAGAGAKHVSFEFLKLPNESMRTDIPALSSVVGFDIIDYMRKRGLRAIGRDYELKADVKRPFVIRARALCAELGIRFGAGDTEFIPWSDGDGCCACSGYFLRDANQFRANFVGVINAALKTNGSQISFDITEKFWSPRRSVSTYLASRSRNADQLSGLSDWLSLLAKRWNGTSGPYSPAFFDGIEWHGKYDRAGFKIYDASRLAESLDVTPKS